jgi:predicted O-methyltransferase YrrM
MLQKLFTLKSYIYYKAKSVNQHGIHSPFVYELYDDIISYPKNYYAFGLIESMRAKYLLNNTAIEIEDFGASGTIKKTKTKKISTIAKGSASTAKQGELLFKLVDYFKPNTILELGTSLGMATMYMAMANKKTNLITIEGSPNISSVAQQSFDKLKLKNIQTYVGNFDDQLKTILHNITTVDFVFIDGNHRKEPTLNYFFLCLQKATDDSVFIFHDIHWSAEMFDAWNEIKQHPRVTITIDLFYLGIVFFKQGRSKEHFTLKF